MDGSWRVIVGPPGTGKTTTLLATVEEELARGTPPDRIGYVSFTRRATEEAQDRAATRFNLTRKQLPYFRTIHSLCMRWLGYRTSQIMEADRLREFAEYIGEPITGRFSQADGTWSGYEPGDRMLFMDGIARVRRQTLRQVYEQDHDDLDWLRVERFARGLAHFKREHELIDYNDMLELFVQRGTRPPLEVLIVDESQDLSDLQWDVIRLLGSGARLVIVAGDGDQAIFRWSGGAVDTFEFMPGDVRVLGQSYRVPRAIQRVADALISKVAHRRPKAWAPRAEEGAVSWIPSVDQINWSGPSILLLARNRYQLDPIADRLQETGVFYSRENVSSVRPTVLSAIVTWERLRAGQPQPAADVVKTYELMGSIARGHRKLPNFQPDQPVTLSELEHVGGCPTRAIWHEALDRIPERERRYLVRCRKRGEMFSRPPRVRLQTIHGSKGGEADRVILLTDLAPRTAEEARRYPDDERRVFYVGVTRAREHLQIVKPRTNLAFKELS